MRQQNREPMSCGGVLFSRSCTLVAGAAVSTQTSSRCSKTPRNYFSDCGPAYEAKCQKSGFGGQGPVFKDPEGDDYHVTNAPDGCAAGGPYRHSGFNYADELCSPATQFPVPGPIWESQKIDGIFDLFEELQLAHVPPEWTCAASAYRDGRGVCNCGCGSRDPDCEGGAAMVVGCGTVGPCHTTTCSVTGACQVTAKPAGAPCDDLDLCTFGDICSQGECAGTPYTCGDSPNCTPDACDGQGGCWCCP